MGLVKRDEVLTDKRIPGISGMNRSNALAPKAGYWIMNDCCLALSGCLTFVREATLSDL
jgi:hypothetical protein